MLFFVFAPYFGSFRLFFQLFSSLNVFKNNPKELKISSQISKKSNDRLGFKNYTSLLSFKKYYYLCIRYSCTRQSVGTRFTEFRIVVRGCLERENVLMSLQINRAPIS